MLVAYFLYIEIFCNFLFNKKKKKNPIYIYNIYICLDLYKYKNENKSLKFCLKTKLSQLMKWSNKILGKRLFTALMKATFYGHFVAGEDQIKIIPTLER